jgi:cell division protein FtsI/penicillin-binding protein 2
MSRRDRLQRRAAPLIAIAAAAFLAGLLYGALRDSETERVAKDYARAWDEGDFGAMWRLLSPTAQGELTPQELEAAYDDAMATATGQDVDAGDVEESGDGAAVKVNVDTRIFGRLRGEVELPIEDGRVDFRPHMVFPGLSDGVTLTRETTAPPRAKILARDGQVFVEGPVEARISPLGAAGTQIAGEVGPAETAEEQDAVYARGFERDTPVGLSGLERVLEEQVAGTPGGRLMAGGKILADTEPTPAEPARTTLDVDIQNAATLALAGRFGGIAALDAKTGQVRGLAGIAFSAPQPPGSTFKIITTAAALENKLVKPTDEFPVVSHAVIDGVQLENANGEFCGGSFSNSFAHSCNSVFAPLGVEVGAEDLVEMAERFGFNKEPTLPGALASTLPTAEEIASPLELGATAIGQGRVLATPLMLASMSQVIASGGVLREPTIARDGVKPQPVRVIKRRIAKTIEALMVGVVNYGTGTAASLAPTGVAGKTGTAELEDTTDEEDPENPSPPGSDTDAWFTAYAPVKDPEIAVGVLFVRAGSGGETAAPAARVVLQAALAD